MSDVTIESLQKELDIAKQNMKGMIAQLEVSKQLHNEKLQSDYQARVNIELMKMTNQELTQQVNDMKNVNMRLANEILELTPKIEGEQNASDQVSEQPSA